MAKVTTFNPFAGGVKNNGATVVYGKTRGSTVTQALGRSLVGYHDTFGGLHVQVPVVRDPSLLNQSKIKPFSAGPYCQMRAGKYIIRGVTREIATIANTTILNGPANRGRRSIPYNEHNNTLIKNGVTVSYTTGRPSSPYAVQVDQFGNDNAARPTRAVPGQIVQTYGLRTGPKTSNYSPKNT